MAKENYRKNSILKHYVDICNLVDGDVSAEVKLDYDGMIKGEELADLHDQIVVKLPMTKEVLWLLNIFLTKVLKRM
jgi:transaldolase